MDDARLDQPDQRLRAIRLQVRSIEQTPVRGRRFIRKRIYADGRRFERCLFDHCTIVVELGAYSAVHCSFDGCEYEFVGPAQAVAMAADGARPAADGASGAEVVLRAI